MTSLITKFYDELRNGKNLIVMPISRFEIDEEFNMGQFNFYPADTVNLDELRIVPNDNLERCQPGSHLDLREVQSSITGISTEVLRDNTLVAFPAYMDWPRFLSGDHAYDISLIRKFSAEAEEAMDLIRFYFCRMDLPDTLPGNVGTWEGSNGFSGALLYTLADNESYLIGGSAITHHVVVGIGLEVNQDNGHLNEQFTLINNGGEVGSIARTALSLFSTVLESNTPTTKFIQSMFLLDFLGNPYKSTDFNIKKFKKNIICHISKTKDDYHFISHRINELTGKKDPTGNPIGYRTLIVHNGKRLEDLIENELDITKLLLELQSYIGLNIEALIKNSHQTWEEFMQYKAQLLDYIGI